MKYVFLFIALVTASLIGAATPAHAETSLGIKPLLVQTTLGQGEKQQGVIDLTNPTSNDLVLRLSVQGFRQLDNQGTLTFFDDEQLRAGIALDYETVALPAKKTLRLVYQVDGTKLPQGDVFAAIFATGTQGVDQTATGVRVGTLLVISNGTPESHQARVAASDISWLQPTGMLRGTVSIENTAPINTSNGFFPEVSLSLWPFGPSTTIKGPLVFSGITRTVNVTAFKDVVGIYKLSIKTGDSTVEQLVVLLPPAWIAFILAILGAAAFAVWRILTRRARKLAKHRPRPLKK